MKKEKFFLSILLLAIIDQVLKLIVILYKNSLPIEIIKNFLEIVYCENKGAAFSIGSGSTTVITIITAIMMTLILWAIYKYYSKFSKVILMGSAFLISGGIGNLLDRAFRHYVVDFIYFKVIDFPIFNFADICVVIGVIVICLGLVIGDRGEKVDKNNSK